MKNTIRTWGNKRGAALSFDEYWMNEVIKTVGDYNNKENPANLVRDSEGRLILFGHGSSEGGIGVGNGKWLPAPDAVEYVKDNLSPEAAEKLAVQQGEDVFVSCCYPSAQVKGTSKTGHNVETILEANVPLRYDVEGTTLHTEAADDIAERVYGNRRVEETKRAKLTDMYNRYKKLEENAPGSKEAIQANRDYSNALKDYTDDIRAKRIAAQESSREKTLDVEVDSRRLMGDVDPVENWKMGRDLSVPGEIDKWIDEPLRPVMEELQEMGLGDSTFASAAAKHNERAMVAFDLDKLSLENQRILTEELGAELTDVQSKTHGGSMRRATLWLDIDKDTPVEDVTSHFVENVKRLVPQDTKPEVIGVMDDNFNVEPPARAEVAKEVTEQQVVEPPRHTRPEQPAARQAREVTEELAEEALEAEPGASGRVAAEILEDVAEETTEDAARRAATRKTVREAAEGVEDIIRPKGKTGIIVAGAALIGITAFGLASRGNSRKKRRRDGISLDSQASQMHYYT